MVCVMPSARALAVIMLGEVGFAAAERFGDDDRDVVGRFGDDGADRGFDLDGLARLEAELGRRLRGGVGRDRHFASTS